MAKPTSKPLRWLGRLVKGLIGLLLIPPLIGVLQGSAQHLQTIPLGSKSFSDWVGIGMTAYLGAHLLLWKPTVLFRVQHRLLSRLSLWLFGGQVSTVTPTEGKKSATSKREAQKSAEHAEGSTLLVLSPYLIPLYTMLIALGSWLLRRWLDPRWLDAPTAVVIGASLAMHWVMTADDLQQNRDRFPIDTYLLSLILIGLVSALVAAACLPFAAPGLSLPTILAEAAAGSRAVYAAVFRTLFL